MAFTTVRSVRPVSASGPRAVRSARPSVRPMSRFVLRAEPEKATTVETAIKEAEEACEGGSTGECAAAWDAVEEISAAVSHKKAAEGPVDPLEKYCDDNPDADECRVYED